MTPETEAEFAGIIKGADTPLRIEGGGTRPIGGATNGARLSAAAMRGIELYEPGALTLVARAGTPLEEVKAALAAEGQRLAFEPMDHRGLLGTQGTPTIGGVVAANVSGPRRVQAGACRDFLLGVRFVDGAGRIVRNGGRVMKNVTGYDLVKLMAGSYGTLGVLTEVALKVLPAPQAPLPAQPAGEARLALSPEPAQPPVPEPGEPGAAPDPAAEPEAAEPAQPQRPAATVPEVQTAVTAPVAPARRTGRAGRPAGI